MSIVDCDLHSNVPSWAKSKARPILGLISFMLVAVTFVSFELEQAMKKIENSIEIDK